MDSESKGNVGLMVDKNKINQANQFVLLVSKEKVSSALSSRIELGNDLLRQPLGIKHFFNETQRDYFKWDDYNSKLLLKLFAESAVSAEYIDIPTYQGYIFGDLEEDAIYFKKSIQEKVTLLESILEQLDLYSEPSPGNAEIYEQDVENQKLSKEIFIVHDRDKEIKESVAGIIEKLGLKPIILHEQPNKGRTIINKFEDYSNVGFAVVLLTPDDVAAIATDGKNLKNRARQNVILELGFFMGKLGLEKICVLHKGDIELPSDYDGVIYIPFDDHGGWQLKLVKKLKAAGYDVNLDEIIK